MESSNIRFRRVLNKLTYAITNENPQPLTRRIMLDVTMRKVGRIYLKGLRHEIERILLGSEPTLLNELEQKATNIKRHLREEQRDWRGGPSRLPTNRFTNY